MNNFKGKLVALDGPDGCGKSTQVRMLCEWLEAQGVTVTRFRDPGDTTIGERIREILLSPEHDRMGAMTEMLLFMASRAQLWTEKIGPALAAGHCVVMDRWLSSTCAYQGHAGGFGVDRVINIADNCLERVWPDMTVVLDVDLRTAAQRMDRALDRMEQKGDSYHQQVREGFLNLANGRPGFSIVDATQSVTEVHRAVTDVVSRTL
ncbi:dTMP kinase [Planctomycetota bacterium]